MPRLISSVSLRKQSGVATLLALALTAGAFAVGLYFKYFTDHVDHPAEQAAEQVLDANGIDVDFSKDKKD
jgi:hypothetical protein